MFLIQTIYQWLFLVPLIGGRWYIITQVAVYTTYILPIGPLYATYHLSREPGNSIEYISAKKWSMNSTSNMCFLKWLELFFWNQNQILQPFTRWMPPTAKQNTIGDVWLLGHFHPFTLDPNLRQVRENRPVESTQRYTKPRYVWRLLMDDGYYILYSVICQPPKVYHMSTILGGCTINIEDILSRCFINTQDSWCPTIILIFLNELILTIESTLVKFPP